MQGEHHLLNNFPGASNLMPWKVASWAKQSNDKGVKDNYKRIKDIAVNTAKGTEQYKSIKKAMEKAKKSKKYQ